MSSVVTTTRVYSEGMANCTENVQLYMSNNNPILNNELTYTQDVKITSLATGTNYLNLTTAALSNVGSLIFEGNGTPTATKPLIINVVLTSDYVWNNSNMNGISNAAAQYIIWNFSGTNTHTLTINTAAQIKGSVFAPNHDLIKLGTGDIEGGIIAKTIDIGIGEIHYYQFASSIDLCGSTNEICNNGIDDDGDSLIDEDCPTNNNCPNDLTNNEFDNGTTDWWMYAQDGNTATHTVDNANQLSGINSSKIAISTASGTDWHIQLGQSGKHIEVGKIYEVSFEAKAAANKTITVLLELDAAPWTGYFKRVVNLTSTPTTYTFTYHANHTITGNLNLLFNLAGNSEDVWIDNVFFGETCATYEICDNGIDDDGDGLVDCDDPDCSIISNGGIEEQGYNFSYASNLEGSPAERLVNGEAMPEWVAGLSGTCMYYVNDTGETVNNPEGDFFIWLPTAGDCFVNTTYFSDLGMVDGNQYTISFHAASWDISLDGSCYPDGGTTTQGQGLINVETEDFSNNSVVLASLSVPQSNSWTNLNWQKYKYTFIYDAANQSKFVLTNGTTRGIALDNVILSKADCVPSILEICDNGIDDDGDTDVDCADSDCQSLNLTNPTVSACINQPLRDVATVSVQVSWTNGPSGDDIEVSLGDKTETIFVSSGATSPQTIEFITIADGSTNNTISAIWKNNTTYCNPTTTFDAPVACSNDALACNILYLCGLDKPYDGDSWDHGFIEYVDALNGAQTVTPILTKADGSGMGTYDVMNQNTFVNVTLSDYDLIIVSATTEAHIANDLVNALKNYAGSILNSNYQLIDDLGLSASAGGYTFQTNGYIDNTTSEEIYNFDNINPSYNYVLTRGDYAAAADGYLWTYNNDQSARTNSIIFHYEASDALPGLSGGHGTRTYLGYHMNGIYANPVNEGALPAPIATYFSPEKHLTLKGKELFDQALVLAASGCNLVEICDNSLDDDGDGLVDVNDPDCTTPTCTGTITIPCFDNGTGTVTDDRYWPNIDLNSDTDNWSYTASDNQGNNWTHGASGGDLPHSYYRMDTYPITINITGGQNGCIQTFTITDPPACSVACDNLAYTEVSTICVNDSMVTTINITNTDNTCWEVIRKIDQSTMVTLSFEQGDGIFTLPPVAISDVQATATPTNYTLWIHSVDCTDNSIIFYDCVQDLVINVPTCPEICDNGIDDDGDGFVDENDMDCCDKIQINAPSFTPDFGLTGTNLQIIYDKTTDSLNFSMTLTGSSPTDNLFPSASNSNNAHFYLVLTRGESPDPNAGAVDNYPKFIISDSQIEGDAYNTTISGNYSETFNGMQITSNGNSKTYTFTIDVTNLLTGINNTGGLLGQEYGIWLFAPDYYSGSNYTIFDVYNGTSSCYTQTQEICDNGIDDDGDGDIDNCDADCNPDFNIPSGCITVNSTGDEGDTNPGDGKCLTVNCDCTLRAAIEEANALAGKDTVCFNIPGPGQNYDGNKWTITPMSLYENLTEAVFINGYTQPGSVAATNSTPAVLKIRINGENLPADGAIFQTTADGSKIAGLVISGNDATSGSCGVNLQSSNNEIVGNCIGVEADGVTAFANSTGVLVNGSNNKIGGVNPADANIIALNAGAGIEVVNVGSNGNTILRNSFTENGKPKSGVEKVTGALIQ